MQLKRPRRQPPPLLLKLKLPGLVAEKLATYRDLYCEHYREEIRIEALAAEIIGQFLERDPALKRRIREGRQDATRDSTHRSASPPGTASES